MAAWEATGPRDGRTGPSPLRDYVVGAAAVLLFGAALCLDALAPPGPGAGFVYVVPFLVVVLGLPRISPLTAAAATILLSAAGFLLSPSGVTAVGAIAGGSPLWVIAAGIPAGLALVGRAGSWLLVAGTAVAVDRYRRESSGPVPLNDRYRVLFREHEAAVLVIDPADGRIVDANPAAARFFWSSPDALRAMQVAYPTGTPDGADQQPWSPLRLVYAHAAGERRYVEVFSVPVTMEARTLLYSTVFDVTDAHHAGEAVRESETRHRSLVDELPEGMVLTGVIAGTGGLAEDFRILDLNAAGERVFGRTRDRAIGKTLRELFGEPVPSWFEAFIRVAGTGRSETIPFEGPADGQRFEVRLYRPAPDLVAGLFIDMTRRLTAEEALRRSNAHLERFARLAGHDLREPLWTIVSFTELLVHRSGDRLDPSDREVLDYILAGGRRMERQIDALLSDASVEILPLVLEPVDVGKTLAAAQVSLAVPLRESGTVVTHGPLPVVRADRSMLEQVLAYLIADAIEVGGVKPSRVHVSAERAGGWWRILVADNRAGVPAELRGGIFEPFRRGHGRADDEGHGIGRATVRGLVERQGGTVRVEAVPGGGSVFSFTVPAPDGPAAPDGPSRAGG